MGISKMFNGLFDRLCVVAGAFIGSQIPSFMQQYIQRLSGHIEELKIQINAWRHLASVSGKGLSEYISKFTTHSDIDFSQHGELMQSMINRLDDFVKALNAYQTSGILERPFAFLAHVKGEIFDGTLHAFVPQLTLTAEGGCYAVAGMLCGYLFFNIFAKLIQFGTSYAPAHDR